MRRMTNVDGGAWVSIKSSFDQLRKEGLHPVSTTSGFTAAPHHELVTASDYGRSWPWSDVGTAGL